jgi:hypothetical protein
MQPQYENYPFWMIALANLVSLSIYALGIFIFAQWGIIVGIIYFIYCILVEINLYRNGCANCYYYDKYCSFGRGKICAVLFSKGDPQKFINRKPTWKDILPDLMLLIFPVIAGIISLILQYSWVVLGAIVIIIILSFLGNAFIRGSIACKHCKQKELGCPAAQLFNQTNS